MNKHVGYCIKLLCNEKFRSQIKEIRDEYLLPFKNDKSIEVLPFPPVDFNDKEIEYIWSEEITGWSNDDFVYICEDKPYSMITGYRTKDNVDVYLEPYIMTKEQRKKILKFIEQWTFNFIFPLNKYSYINTNELREICNFMFLPLYNFISCCVVFNMDTIYGENMKYLFPPARYWIKDYKEIIVENIISNIKLETIMNLLYDEGTNKEDIIYEIERESFKKRIENIKKKAKESPPVLGFPGKLPSKKEWMKIWEIQYSINFAGSEERMDYISAYTLYLKKKLNDITYEKLAEEENLSAQWVKEKIYKLCDNLGIQKP